MSTLNDNDRENLAAYLDGELDEQASQELEAKLNRDPEARKEVEALRKAWSMLDFLPRPEPSPSFTHRTMERLTMVVPRGAPTARMPRPRSLPWMLPVFWSLAVLLAIAVGAWGGRLLWQGREANDPVSDVLSKRSQLIEFFDLYEPLVDVSFLKSLDHADLFQEDVFADETERNRANKHPEPTESERLARARKFLSLPAERQEQLVQLDHDLFDKSVTPELRERLFGVARRYRLWLEKLKDAERDRITQEQDGKESLAVVRELRDLQWLRKQPKAHRARYESLKGQERADLMKKLHKEDRLRQRSWRVALMYWDELHSKPFVRRNNLPKEVRDYVGEYLDHMLSKEEKERLTRAEGSWPGFPQTLVELADRHPPALPGPIGPTTFAELPRAVQRALQHSISRPSIKKIDKGPTKKEKAALAALRLKEGNWPGYGIAVSDMLSQKKVIPEFEFLPRRADCLSPLMRDFINKKLMPALTPDETRKLYSEFDKWPNYPLAIQELAKVHNLHPPWFVLPGPRERWDNYRLHKGDIPVEAPR